jgi:exopolyphosphatase/guanosine-5'-triphosphate,3'-diphosphate pyrophosphatase
MADSLSGSSTLAAVDLGSNSFHMVVARESEGHPVLIDRLRDRVGLAEGLRPDGGIEEEVKQRALACLERFGQRIAGIPATRVRAVGTATFRAARDSFDFHGRAEEALGRRIEILGGREEARLIYLGVAHSLAGDGQRRLVIDIGGASTECIIGVDFESQVEESLKMGCVTFSQEYFPNGRITNKAFHSAITEARRQLEPIATALRNRGWEQAVGSSGTVHATAQILAQNDWGNGSITADGLKSLVNEVLRQRTVEELDLSGLKEDRKLVLPGGIAIVQGLFDGLGLEELHPSPGALREGLLHDLLGRLHHADVRSGSVTAFGLRLGIDETQASRVRSMSTELFDVLQGAWSFTSEHRDLLSWAAWLHAVGLSVSYSGYHHHGAYLVENADLTGFSREDQRRVATLVHLHRKRFRTSYIERESEPWQLILKRLAILLRLGVALHRGRGAGDIERPGVNLGEDADHLQLKFPEGWLEAHPLTHVDLELESDLAREAGFVLTVE